MTKSLVHAPHDRAPIALGMTFDDPPRFHRTVLRAVLGGGAGAFLAHGIARVLELGDSFPFLVTMITAGALALVAGKKSRLHGLVGAVLGLTGGVLWSQYGGDWPWFGALLLGAAAAPVLASGEGPARMAATGAFTGLMAFAGLYVAGVMQSQGVLAGLVPAALASAAAGSAAGLFIGLGGAARHVVPADDLVEAAYVRALRQVRGEVQEILQRALGIYRAVQKDLGSRGGTATELALESKVRDMSLRLLDIGDKCQAIEADLQASPVSELDDRIAQLEQKAQAANDASARETLRQAIDSLEEQRTGLTRIRRGRERVVARMHANVALLEKVRFSLVHLRSADAERAGSQQTPLGQALEELSRELDATSQAIGEVYGGAQELGSGDLPELPEPTPDTSPVSQRPPLDLDTD